PRIRRAGSTAARSTLDATARSTQARASRPDFPTQGAAMSESRHAVFGHPIAHSLSPRIHAHFGRQTGIALHFEAIDATPETFPTALEAFAAGGGTGANVTLPLKE